MTDDFQDKDHQKRVEEMKDLFDRLLGALPDNGVLTNDDVICVLANFSGAILSGVADAQQTFIGGPLASFVQKLAEACGAQTNVHEIELDQPETKH